MTDDELLKCLERYPQGPPVTLYHVDANGGFVKGVVESNGKLTLGNGQFHLTTNVEARTGFKGGKGLDGGIVAFQVDRRLVLLLQDLSVKQTGAGQFEDGLNALFHQMADAAEAQKTGQRPEPGRGKILTFPQVTFEGGGRKVKLPEGDANFMLPISAERPEWKRIFELTVQKIRRMRLDPSLPPGQRTVVMAEWVPVVPARPRQPKVPALPPPGPLPNIGPRGEVRLPDAEYLREARLQVKGWGALMLLGGLNDLLVEHFIDPDQKKRAEEDLGHYQEWIDRHRAEVPTEGVLVRLYYIQEGSPAGEGVSVVKAPKIYNYLEVTFGVTQDEAERKPRADAISQAGSRFATYPHVDSWTPPLVQPTVNDIKTPLRKQAVGTFAAGKEKLQQVVCDSFWGFDDQPMLWNIQVPDGTQVRFIVLDMPTEISWFAGPYAKEPVRLRPPIVVREAAAGGSVRVVDLDPYLWGKASAAPVFPADEETARVFATFPQTIDRDGVLRMKYPNFDRVRWVRPEHMVLVGALGDTHTSTAARGGGAAPPPRARRPIQWYKPGKAELAPQAEWGGVAPNNPKVYVVGPGDNLNTISEKLYGSPDKWEKIFEANRGKIDPTTYTVYPGQRLRLAEPPKPKPPTPAAPPPKPGPFDPNIA